ncbi:CD276 antigen homolog isoform X1 [Epinephelus lanceolatus]
MFLIYLFMAVFRMFHQWSGRVSVSHLSAVSALVFLLLTHSCEGASQMIGPSKPILAMVGDDVVLPCHLEPAADVVAKTLEWARLDLNPRFVNVRRDGVALLQDQNPSYLGRTSLSTDKLRQGDISLKLSKVRLSDEGKYRCHIPNLGTSTAELIVGAFSSPAVIIAEMDRAGSRVVLECKSAGWYPEPEVLWLDREGNLLSAGPPETVRGPDDLYTVSSRVTVEKRHGNSFTCRVQQRNINQTREINLQITEDILEVPSCTVRVIIISSVCVVFSCICAALLVLGKLRQNNGQNKHCDNETVDGAAEGEQLPSTKDLIDEKLEEKKDMEHVIRALMEEKTELETSRDKLKTELVKVEEEKKKNEKKLDKLEKHFDVKKQEKKLLLSQNNVELDNKNLEYKESLQRTKEKLEKTEDMIQRITEWKKKVEKQIEQMKKRLEETERGAPGQTSVGEVG